MEYIILQQVSSRFWVGWHVSSAIPILSLSKLKTYVRLSSVYRGWFKKWLDMDGMHNDFAIG